MTRFIGKTTNYSGLYRYVRHRQSDGIENLLTFVRPNFGGKVIFVGTPAQLPPASELVSLVFEEQKDNVETIP